MHTITRAAAVLLAALACAASAPAVAHGDWFDDAAATGTPVTHRADMQRYLRIARGYWGARGLSLDAACPAPGPAVLAAATPPEGDAWARAGTCTILFNRVAWRGFYRHNPAFACTTIAHEAGHILGQEHSETLTSVMYVAGPRPLEAMPRGCRRMMWR